MIRRRARPALLATVLLCLLLSACERSSPPPADSVEALGASDVSAEFDLLAVEGSGNDERPSLSLRFNRPLAQAQDFDRLLAVSDAAGKPVEGAWMLDYRDGSTLRFPYVEAEARYRVVLEAGLVAADGSTLDRRIEREIAAVRIPPTVGFASQGSVLPARDTEGLPLLAVNVSEVDVEFFRVRPQRLSRFFAEYARQGRRWNWDLQGIGDLADSVYSQRFALSASDNERKVHHLPVQEISELDAAGVYFAVLRPAASFDGRFETTHYFRSDIGLHTRQYRDGMLLHAASLASGRALADVEFSILDRQGREVLRASSDGQGLAQISYQRHPEHVLVARRGAEASVLSFGQAALDLSEFDLAGPPAEPVSLFIWSGRDLYRPGESVRFHALARDHDGRSLGTPPPLFAQLRQPDGRAHLREQLQPDAFGAYQLERQLGEQVPTGRWVLELSTTPEGGRAAHRYPFRVEEFLPERLKLELSSSRQQLAPSETLPLQVQASYLYGAAAAGNRFTAALLLRAASDPFPGWPGYRAGDQSQPPSGNPVDLLDLRLDASGSARSDLPVAVEGITLPLTVSVVGRVFESGGRPVTRVLSLPWWPAQSWIAARPRFEDDRADRRAVFDLRRLDPAGANLAPVEVELRLIREERDYHWRHDSELGWRADFTSRYVTVGSRRLMVGGEQASELAFDVEWGNYRLEVSDPESGALTRLPFVAGWGFDDPNQGLDARPDKVKLALDRMAYRAGDELTLTITSPHDGPGLLLVEADALLEAIPLQVSGSTTQRLRIPPEWERHDVYLTALVLRPGEQRERISPRRAIGITHLPIDRAERRVEVQLQAPELARPGEQLQVRISAPALAGSEARVQLHAVDQGILNITAFAVPDAFASFFARRRLAVEAFDLYGRVIEALAGERARLRYGGDAALLTALPQARRPTARVQTVDLASAPVSLDARGEAELAFTLPEFNGALRLAAVVYAADRYGAAAGSTRVRAPISVEASTPRVMAPGDRALLTIDLDNGTGQPQDFSIAVSSEGPISVEQERAQLRLPADARGSVSLPLRALAGIGSGRFSIRASGGGEVTERSFELVVRPAWPAERRSRLQRFEVPAQIDLPGPPQDWLAASVQTRVTLTPRAPVPGLAAFQALAAYPLACVEQTTSKGWAWLLASPANAAALGMPDDQLAKRDAQVRAAIDRIGSLQYDNGHFAFWPGGDFQDPLLTPFVAEFLLDAREAGYSVPDSVLQAALERLKEELLSGGAVAWSRYYGPPAEHARLAFNAHAALVLARVGQAPLGTLRTLLEKQGERALNGLPLTRLGLALILAGDATLGARAIEQSLQQRLWQGQGERFGYGQIIGQQAEQLHLLLAAGQLPATAQPRLLDVARDSVNARWLSTHDQISLLRLAATTAAGGGATLDVRILGADPLEHLVEQRVVSRDFDAARLRAGVRLQVEADAPVWLAEERVGVPQQPPAVSGEGLSIERLYYSLDGQPWRGERLREGEGLLVLLRARAAEDVPDALILDLLPGGLELENPALMDEDLKADIVIEGSSIAERLGWRPVQFEEYRDDRYSAAVNLGGGSTVELIYVARAVSPGDYSVPPPQIEDMYRPALRGIGSSPLSRLRVDRADTP